MKVKKGIRGLLACTLAAALILGAVPVSFVPDVAEAAVTTGRLLGDASTGFYVNMPKKNSPNNAPDIDLTPVLNAGATTVKVYDDGGRDGAYSNDCFGYLVLTAPEGYLLQLTGSLETEPGISCIDDYLNVYDGTQVGAAALLEKACSPKAGQPYTISAPILSDGRQLKFQFVSDDDSVNKYSGLDLTVTLVRDSGKHAITCNSETGGTVTCGVQEDRPGKTISLTAHPANGYLTEGFRVVNTVTNESVDVDGDVRWYDGEPTGTFVMPDAPVSVSGIFSSDVTARSIRMPADNSTINAAIPSCVSSFKIYDDGGADGDFTRGCRGSLILTAPEGYRLSLSGTVATENERSQGLSVFDSNDSISSAAVPGSPFNSSSDGALQSIGWIQSTGNCLYLSFKQSSESFHTYAGLDLTVNVYNPTQKYDIVLPVSATNGTVVTDQTDNKASAGDTVTLTATPREGYLLSDLTVTDRSSGLPLRVTGGNFLTNTASFTMPASGVTVTPAFTADKTGLSVNMPATGSISGNIPSGITSFIIYPDGGTDQYYSANCDSTLTFTAPEGHVIQFTKTTDLGDGDVLSVYDGGATDATLLYHSKKQINTVFTSSGRSVTIHFTSNNESNGRYMLTAELIDTAKPYALVIENPASGGEVTASAGSEPVTSATVHSEVTLTASPASGYKLTELNVTDGDGKVYDIGWHGSFEESVTFCMPAKDLTIRPVFSDDLTAEGGVFINMPKTGITTVDAIALSGVTSFKVYDDGGANGEYSSGCDGTLSLTTDEDKAFCLNGTFHTFKNAPLTIYNGANMQSEVLVNTSADGIFEKKTITTATTGNGLTLHFSSPSSLGGSGLNLTVMVCDPDLTYGLTAPEEITGGRIGVTVDGTAAVSARPGRTVIVRATPDSGYVFEGITVKEGDRTVTSHGGWYDDNKASFIMPVGDVRITPVFKRGYCTIPVSEGSRSVIIPSGVESVRINRTDQYDFDTSLLTMTAPADHVIHLNGTMVFDVFSQKLTVYDGCDDRADVLYSMSGTDWLAAKPDVVSTDSSITIKTELKRREVSPLLTATVGRRIRTADNLTHGSIRTDKSFAADGETVTVTPSADTDYEVKLRTE